MNSSKSLKLLNNISVISSIASFPSKKQHNEKNSEGKIENLCMASLQDLDSQSFKCQNTSFFSQSQLITFQEFTQDSYSLDQYHQMLERFLTNVRQDNLEETKYLYNLHLERVKSHPKNNWDLLNDTSIWGWSSLHCAAYFGLDKMYLWLLSEGADLQLKTTDGWTCFTLAVWQNHPTIVTLLMGQPNLDINHLAPNGTALHLAASYDNLKIIKLLLQHPKIDVTIRDQQNKLPIEVAGPQTRQVLNLENQKLFQSNNGKEEKLLETFRSSISNFIRMTNISQNSLVVNVPKRTPLVKGMVLKVGYCKLFMQARYLIIDAESGVLARYKKESDSPYNPNELIPLESIDDIRFSKDRWFERDDYHYIKINYFNKEIFIVLKHRQAAKKWISYLKAAVGYVKYVQNKVDYYFKTNQSKKAIAGVVKLMLEPEVSEVQITDSSQVLELNPKKQQQKERTKSQSQQKGQFQNEPQNLVLQDILNN